jgi:hypothetical protein
MRTVRITDENIVTVLNVGSWILLALMAGAGLLLVSRKFALGVLAGGVLAIANFHWLHSIMKRALLLPVEKVSGFARIRYVLRLAIVAIIIWIMIIRFGIDLIGLLVGLSVLVINIFALTIYRLISKGG